MPENTTFLELLESSGKSLLERDFMLDSANFTLDSAPKFLLFSKRLSLQKIYFIYANLMPSALKFGI